MPVTVPCRYRGIGRLTSSSSLCLSSLTAGVFMTLAKRCLRSNSSGLACSTSRDKQATAAACKQCKVNDCCLYVGLLSRFQSTGQRQDVAAEAGHLKLPQALKDILCAYFVSHTAMHMQTTLHPANLNPSSPGPCCWQPVLHHGHRCSSWTSARTPPGRPPPSAGLQRAAGCWG